MVYMEIAALSTVGASLWTRRYRVAMRWERLFSDLEEHWGAVERAALDAEIAERARDERAAVTLGSRLAAAGDAPVGLVLRDGSRVSGRIADAAGSWVLLDAGAEEVLVPLAAVAAVESLGHRAVELGAVAVRIRMTTVLRSLAEARVDVVVVTDAALWPGVIAAVGADHIDLVSDGRTRAVLLDAILAVRSRP